MADSDFRPSSPVVAPACFHLDKIPFALSLENEALSVSMDGPQSLTLEAPPRTDLFIASDGANPTDHSPRLMFRPNSQFILTAKIRPTFRAKWDAGALLIYNDSSHFAKFCYEMDYRGDSRIVSVVCNGTADDCNSMAVPGGSAYLRAVGNVTRDVATFYFSENGKSWFLIRTFRLHRAQNLRIGFCAQSPAGEGCLVRFEEIDCQFRAPADYWAGD